MSVDIEIKQGGLFKKSLDLGFLKSLCDKQGLSYGVANHAIALDDYQGGNDIAGISFVVYNRGKIGRGFNFWIGDNKKDCFVRLNNPCTDEDVSDFYNFIDAACERLKAKRFSQDGIIKNREEIMQIRENITEWNRTVLREQMTGDFIEWCIFGAVYPVFIEDSFREQIPYLNDRDVMASYIKYLHEKQARDCYYAKAIMYEDNAGNIFGRYAITEGVESIFPLKPYITMGANLDKQTAVKEWSVALGFFENGEYSSAGAMDFYDFVSKLNLNESTNKFDAKHVIINISKEDINMLMGGR